ncbi:hypothetical protein C8R44DRAFT_53350 [Mycena epipterygia]|nr:hypothetical protein C8R44DRAFT_53350 [Mycena epipterygia]
MTSRPDYTIYEDCLLHLHHGRPVWKADPGPKEKIEVGDIGYYLYGQFKRVGHLPLGEICGESHSIENQTIPFPKPVKKQIRRKVAYSAGAGAAPSIPVEIGGKASVKTEHLETAALSLQIRQAMFSFLDRGDQARVESYAIKHYKQWLKDDKFYGLALADIVIILGTYMTKNWVATASATDSKELSGDIHVNVPHIANAHGGVASQDSQGSTLGYNCGHLHAGVSKIAPSTDLKHFQKMRPRWVLSSSDSMRIYSHIAFSGKNTTVGTRTRGSHRPRRIHRYQAQTCIPDGRLIHSTQWISSSFN